VDMVLSGARPPYEQSPPGDSEDLDSLSSVDSDDGFSNTSSQSGDSTPLGELRHRFEVVVDIVSDLYKLSMVIRSSASHSRTSRAMKFKSVDPATGVDVFSAYGALDLAYITETTRQLRRDTTGSWDQEVEGDALINRLAEAITRRRRQFMYRRSHRDKLGTVYNAKDSLAHDGPLSTRKPNADNNTDSISGKVKQLPAAIGLSEAIERGSTSGGTFLAPSVTPTTASTFIPTDTFADEENQSTTTYATTYTSTSETRVGLPPPPRSAVRGLEWECPYCFEIIPDMKSHHSWR